MSNTDNTASLRLVIASHNNDYRIDGNQQHHDFVEFLLTKYEDTRTEINPDKEWAEFLLTTKGAKIKKRTTWNGRITLDFTYTIDPEWKSGINTEQEAQERLMELMLRLQNEGPNWSYKADQFTAIVQKEQD